ncbi:hypothetical protein [Methylomonas methanica]|uniref:Uncharacterized protein n=1 Tax=Methylomonas methanica (strain DSM 25384 / MC09) TaxID=857087 RepID=G0A3M2_METMM|nr:hypothetical protein [Methylomonas methanica]AEG01494.1 hypothetical protein Metme_3118 [Methylomonas methanica MC09]
MNLLKKSDEEILNEITPIMDNMMEGSTEINHAKHSRDFTDRMKAVVTPESLEYMCNDYQSRWGLFGKREFVALFRRKHSIAVVWKQYCSNSTDEYVAEAVFVERNNRLLIDHAMVY